MSLEDKFYPEDGSILTRYDNFMIKSAGKVGEAYQHLTGNSYKDLVKTSYWASIAGFGLSLLGLRASALLVGLFPYKGLHHPEYESPLEEEIRSEMKGEPRKVGKLFRATVMMAIPFVLYLGFKVVEKGISEDSTLFKYIGVGGVIEGISLMPYIFAEYLTKSDIPKLPEHTVWEKAKLKLKELVAPNPEPALAYLDSPQLSLAALSSDYHFT